MNGLSLCSAVSALSKKTGYRRNFSFKQKRGADERHSRVLGDEVDSQDAWVVCFVR